MISGSTSGVPATQSREGTLGEFKSISSPAPNQPVKTEHLFYDRGVDSAEPRLTDVEYEEVQCKSALNPVKGMGFNWSLNPYTGCEHRCAFCYVRAFELRADRPSDDRPDHSSDQHYADHPFLHHRRKPEGSFNEEGSSGYDTHVITVENSAERSDRRNAIDETAIHTRLGWEAGLGHRCTSGASYSIVCK